MGLRMTLAPPNLLCRRRFALRRVEGGFGIKYPVTLRSPSGSDAGSNYSPRSGSDSDDLELIPTPPLPNALVRHPRPSLPSRGQVLR